MASALELRFTDPAAPLFIDIEGDESDGLFVISTSQLQASTGSNANTRYSSTPKPQQPGGQKRPYAGNEAQQFLNTSGSGRERSETPRVEKVKKSMKAVQRMEVSAGTSASRENSAMINDEHMMPPPPIPKPNRTQGSQSFVFHASQNGDFGVMDDFYSGGLGDEAGPIDGNAGGGSRKGDEDSLLSRPGDPLFYPQSSQIVPPPVPSTCERPAETQRAKTPLFFPPSQLSQLSQQNEQAIKESGLGIEYMDQEELEAMLEGDGEEVEFEAAKGMGSGTGFSNDGGEGRESLDLFENEFGPTQDGDKEGRKVSPFRSFLLTLCDIGFQAFQPLFED